MPKTGCRENSKMSNALELLALKGIDCVKITGTQYRMGKTAFYPINMFNEGDFINDIKECGGSVLTNDFMEIEIDYMSGDEIMKHNPSLKLENNKAYNVVKIGYTTDDCLLSVVR